MVFRVFLPIWIVAWSVVAVVGVEAVRHSKASDSSPVQLIVQGAGSATLQGVEVRILSVESGLSETVVTIEVAGREAEGSSVELMARSELVAADRSRYRETQGEADGRRLTLHFPPVSQTELAGGRLELPGLTIRDAPRSHSGDTDGVLIGGFILQLPLESVVAISGADVPLALEAALGAGLLRVESVVLEPDATVFRGRLLGFSELQIQQIVLKPKIETAEGRAVKFFTSRSGDGDGLTQVEFRFGDVGDADVVVLSVLLARTDSPGPDGTDAWNSLADSANSVATLTVDLSPR